jgi:hypothetical protein
MYQLARLGYSSVMAYQRNAGLKVDGIIGPQTKGKVEEEFDRTFGSLAQAQTNAPLMLTVEVITNAAMASLSITLSNQLNTPVCIVGVLAADRDDRLTFLPPVISVRESFCRRIPKTGIVGCGGESNKTKLCSPGTKIMAGARLQCSTAVSYLFPDEDGSVSVDLHYLTSDGTSFQTFVRQKRPTFANDSIVINVANVTVVGEDRQITVDLHIPDSVSLSKDATLLVLIDTDRKNVRPDEFGPPQIFALKSTSREINPHLFQVSVTIPGEKVTVRLILRDGKRTLADQKRNL